MKKMLVLIIGLLLSLNIFSQEINTKLITKKNFITDDRLHIKKELGSKYYRTTDYGNDGIMFDVFYLKDSIKRNEQYFVYYYDRENICFSYKYIFKNTSENVKNVVDYFDKLGNRQLFCPSGSYLCWISELKSKKESFLVYNILYFDYKIDYVIILTIDKNVYDTYNYILNQTKEKVEQNFLYFNKKLNF